VHSDEEVNDILDTMLRDGKAPYGKTRQQYNYRFHPRLLERKANIQVYLKLVSLQGKKLALVTIVPEDEHPLSAAVIESEEEKQHREYPDRSDEEEVDERATADHREKGARSC
jgi:hypothetical protein